MYVSICLCVAVAVSECVCVCLFVWVALFRPVGFCVLWLFCWPYWPSHTAIYTNASHCIIHFVVVANGSTVFKFVLCFRLHFSLICWSQHTYTYTCIVTATGYLSYVGHCGCATRVSASIVLRVVLRIHPAFMTHTHTPTHTPN